MNAVSISTPYLFSKSAITPQPNYKTSFQRLEGIPSVMNLVEVGEPLLVLAGNTAARHRKSSAAVKQDFS